MVGSTLPRLWELPQTTRCDAMQHAVSRVHFLAAFCRSARHCRTAPLRDVLHIKPSWMLGKTRKSFFSMTFLVRSHLSLTKKWTAMMILDLVKRSFSTVCSIAYNNPLVAAHCRVKSCRFAAAWRDAAKLFSVIWVWVRIGMSGHFPKRLTMQASTSMRRTAFFSERGATRDVGHFSFRATLWSPGAETSTGATCTSSRRTSQCSAAHCRRSTPRKSAKS